MQQNLRNYLELVPLFLNAKSKRQVIMVIYNANLVVNTNADQIIFAEAGPHSGGALSPISYTGAGLDNAMIRKAICDILDGGEDAFQELKRKTSFSLSMCCTFIKMIVRPEELHILILAVIYIILGISLNIWYLFPGNNLIILSYNCVRNHALL